MEAKVKSKVFALMCILCLLVAAQTVGAQGNGKVLMILRANPLEPVDPWLSQEALVMKAMMNDAGFDVVTASDSGEVLKGSAASLKPDLKLSEVNVGDYKGVMIPCMGSNDAPISTAVKIVSEAWRQGKPLAAQLGGVDTLGIAGILKGKRFAYQSSYAPYVAGGIYSGTGVVMDGNVATSGLCPYMAEQMGKPDGTVELTRKFIALLQ